MVDAPAKNQTGAENVLWDLSVFYSTLDDPAIQSDMEKLTAEVDAFAQQYRGRVADLNAGEIAEALSAIETMYDTVVRLGSYASLEFSVNTNDPTTGALMQRITEFNSELQQKMLFFDLEWNEVDDDRAEAIINNPAVGKYRHYLEAERRFKPYQLSEIEEKLLVEKSVTGRSAWSRFFSQLTSAMRFEYDGEQLTQSEVLTKLHDENRETRAKAADSVTAGLRERGMELTYIFNVLAADKASSDRMRGYPSWVSSRNLSNKAPDAVVDALIETVTSNYDLVARHYNLKRVLLGYDELYDYDRYAPMPLDAERTDIPWEQARRTVLTAFEAFSPQMSEIAGYFFEKNWIHAPVLEGKRGGAFAAPTTPTAHPFVMVNYTGRQRDISTLAHELGHGVHQYLAGQTQGLFGADTPLTTAEMASVFGEMLVFTDMTEREPDPKVRLAMLTEKIEDTFATVFRQISMNRFEDTMHNARRNEGELSTERLSELWMNTQVAMFGDSVTLREDYGLWWSYVPHFLQVPGYVYAYAFGELLVLALFNLYREHGADFVPQYIDVLKAGGNDYPANILGKVGVDLNDPNFWGKGIAAIRELVEQEEALAREVFPGKFS